MGTSYEGNCMYEHFMRNAAAGKYVSNNPKNLPKIRKNFQKIRKLEKFMNLKYYFDYH